MTTVQKWTGRETLALRQALRMSGRQFAARLGITERTIAKWEAPGQVKTALRPDSQAMLDTMLASAPQDARTRFETALATAASHGTATGQPASPTDTPGSTADFTTTAEQHMHAHGMPVRATGSDRQAMAPDPGPTRHDVLRAGAALSLLDVLAGYPRPPLSGPGARVDGEMAAGLGSIVLGYRQVYRSAGAASLLAPVRDTLGLLTELASSAGAYRDHIVSLIGQAASLAGVILMLDQGDPAAARRYLAVAVRAARQAGDAELLAVTFGCEAFRAAYSGDTAAGAEYAEEACAIAAASGVHPLTHGWTAAVASEMHATAGDADACMRALDTAAAQLEAPMPGTPWKGIGAFSAAKLAAYRGGDLMRLHRYAQAQAELHRALAQLDQAQTKHRCTAHIDLAAAFMLGGEIPEGARHATAALDIIAVTRHADSLRRVTSLYQTARPARTAAVHELHSRLLEVTACS